jgi:hypothetical protein
MSFWTYRRLLVVTMITSVIALTGCGGNAPSAGSSTPATFPTVCAIRTTSIGNPAAFATVCGETQPDPANSCCIRDRVRRKTRSESASANPFGRMFRIRVGHCGAHRHRARMSASAYQTIGEALIPSMHSHRAGKVS